MKKFELMIAGGGLTAARAIKSYRESGGDGPIALISNERDLPYHRPALSKRYLRGETTDTPFAEDAHFYRDHDVEVLLETTATAVDIRARTLTTDAGTFQYDKLLIATGATPRELALPGAGLESVYALRTLRDSQAIRAAAASAERAVVVGGGFIGMEVAASLRQLGLSVTLIHLGRGLFDQFGSDALSEELAALYRGHGVELLLQEEVAGFGSDDQRRLSYVETKSGLCVEAEIAVVGVGVVPNVDFLADSGLDARQRRRRRPALRDATLPASSPQETWPTSSTRSTAASGGSSIGRTRTTREPRSGKSSPAPALATTPSPPSSARSSAPRSRSSATSAASTSRRRKDR